MPSFGRVIALALLLPILAACSSAPSVANGPGGDKPSASADPCAPWGCDQQTRFQAAAAFLAKQKGFLNIVVKDRQTGAVWTAGDTSRRTWAGSTPKLALTVALKEQARAGQISLGSGANANIDAMLHVSDNEAADALWNQYANSAKLMSRWQSMYGMKTASYVDGFQNRWGFVKLTPNDLVSLMSYILDTLNPTDRSYIVDRMRAVGGPQQWGVWGAGAPLQPGVKDGWDYCVEAGDNVYRWVTSTVGFVGPDARYIVAAMYDQTPAQQLDNGVHVITDLIATTFGAPVPAPVVVPPDY